LRSSNDAEAAGDAADVGDRLGTVKAGEWLSNISISRLVVEVAHLVGAVTRRGLRKHHPHLIPDVDAVRLCGEVRSGEVR